MAGYTPLPHDSVAPPPSGILPNTFPDSHAVWTIDVDGGSGQRHGDAVMEPDTPPPPPREPITVTTPVKWANLNVYVVGSEVFGDVAHFEGGSPDTTTYRYRWQTRATEDDEWVNGKWTNYTDHALEISTTLTEAGQIKFQCQARDTGVDPVEQVNSNSGTKTVTAPDALIASNPVVTGEPYVGETLSCSEPIVTGGVGPYQFDYFWVDESNAIVWEAAYMGNTTTIVQYDYGKSMKCLVTVTDKGIEGGETITLPSNSVGPIATYSLGSIAMVNSNTDSSIENGGREEIMQGVSVTYVADISGNMPHEYLVYEWKVRSGSATIRGQDDLPYCTIELPTEFPGSSSLSCSVFANNKFAAPGAGFMWTISYTE